MTLAQLRDKAKELGIKNISGMKKAELEDKILNFEKEETAVPSFMQITRELKDLDKVAIKTPRSRLPENPYAEETEPEILQEEKVTSVKKNDARKVTGILELCEEGYGFLRCENYLTGSGDIFVAPPMIKRFRLKTGDEILGLAKPESPQEKFSPLIYVNEINGQNPIVASRRPQFEKLTPIFPNERLHLESPINDAATRLIDLIAPIGRGQRGIIVSPPKAGKTTLLKNIANSISQNHKDVKLIVLLIDERPEEVTDMQRSIDGEVIYSTFDEVPEHHIRVAEMCLERAKRQVEQKKDVVILLDSITRLSRAYNLVIPPTGKTLSGGLDPAALHKPKWFFGAARNIEFGGSLTIIATALIDTGSKMDDVIFEEFKGTGNMEVHLDRKLQERRIFPAIDVSKSGTRREDLLLSPEELSAMWAIRKALSVQNTAQVTETLLNQLYNSATNYEFVSRINKIYSQR